MEEQVPNKYKQVLVESKVTEDDAFVTKDIEAILSKHFDENNTKDVYKLLFNCIDLTALNSTDTVESIGKMVERVNAFETDYPELKNVAAVCVYPNFAIVVSGGLEVSSVDTAVVAGSFPSSQTFLEVKTAETALAVADGANEVDIVLNLGLFYSNNYEELTDEIAELKHAARNARLKVILALAVATSIDALAVGISFAFTGYNSLASLAFPLTAIGLASFILSVIGCLIGVFCGKRFHFRVEIFGGLVLIGIGTKILVEHLFLQ